MLKTVLKFASLPLFLVLMMSGYAVLWFVGADRLKETAEAWLAGRQQDGWDIRHQGLDVGGFPLKIRLTLAAPRIDAPDDLGGWRMEADALRLEAMVWQAAAPTLRPAGPLRLDLGADGRWQVSGRVLEATLDTGAEARLDGVTLLVEALTALPLSALDDTGQPKKDAVPLTLDRLVVTAQRLDAPPPVDIKTATYGVEASGAGLTLPPTVRAPLGRTWREMQLSARVLGPMPRDASLYDSLLTWRDDGGVLEVDRLYLDWPPLEISIAGTLALDDAMQPVGALSSHVRGFFEAVGHLEDRGLVRARDATMARVVLGSLAQSAPQGEGGPVLTLPMTIQNRQLSMGPVALFELPRVTWSRGRAGAAAVPALLEPRPAYEIDRFGNILRKE